MEEFVRPAVPQDVDELVCLETEYREAARDSRGGTAWLRDHAALMASDWAALLGDASAHTVVSGIDGAVLGVASMHRDPTRNCASIDRIYVTEAAREVGLGDAMLDALVQAARHWGVHDIEAEALPGDRDTKNLYERAGLVARLIVVNKVLG